MTATPLSSAGIGTVLTTLGILLILGFITERLGRRTRLPRVTLLVLFGLVVGESGLDLLPAEARGLYPVLANIALLMMGFLLGERLVVSLRRGQAQAILLVSLGVTLCTALAVGVGLWLSGLPLVLALLFAGIATATDPAATVDVLLERGGHGSFGDLLLGVVAIDDAWGLILFSLLLAFATLTISDAAGTPILLGAAWELGGAILIGVACGLPLAWLSGRLRPGEPTLPEALGAVFFCGGLALLLGCSFLIAVMVQGGTVAMTARHHSSPFHAIENIEEPFLILFFLLAGASLRTDTLSAIGIVGALFMGLRILGRLAGGWLGGWLAGSPRATRNSIGLALLPQAGVAVGMALVASQRFPAVTDILLPVVIAATVLFEIAGPVATRWVVARQH